MKLFKLTIVISALMALSVANAAIVAKLPAQYDIYAARPASDHRMIDANKDGDYAILLNKKEAQAAKFLLSNRSDILKATISAKSRVAYLENVARLRNSLKSHKLQFKRINGNTYIMPSDNQYFDGCGWSKKEADVKNLGSFWDHFTSYVDMQTACHLCALNPLKPRCRLSSSSDKWECVSN